MPVFLINFWNWLTKNAWAQALLAGLATVFALKVIKDRWQSNIEKGVRRIEREAAERQRQEQINSQRQEAHERVEAFTEAARAVERMPDRELRKSTEADPNNRGRVPRD